MAANGRGRYSDEFTIFVPLTHVSRVGLRPGDPFARLLQLEAAVACVQRADALARGAREAISRRRSRFGRCH
jgi:hypothetical protein